MTIRDKTKIQEQQIERKKYADKQTDRQTDKQASRMTECETDKKRKKDNEKTEKWIIYIKKDKERKTDLQ